MVSPFEKDSVISKAGSDTPEGAGSSQLSYTKTRVIKADPAVLCRHRLLTEQTPSEIVDLFKCLREQVMAKLDSHGWKAVAVTSPGMGEGKSLIAANLALCTAMEYGRTVLLIDANFRHPSLHELFGLQVNRGLRDYLLDKTPLEKLLINPGIANLVLLPAGRPVKYPSELLRSPVMAHLVAEVKQRYPERIVIFDLPEVLSKPDVLAFVPYVDTVLLVIAAGKTKDFALREALKYLDKVPLVGTVLNKLR